MDFPFLSDKIAGYSGPQLAVCIPCSRCNSLGKDPDKIYETYATLEETCCKECKGKGWKQQFASIHVIFQYFQHELIQQLPEILPDIITKSKLKILQEILDS